MSEAPYKKTNVSKLAIVPFKDKSLSSKDPLGPYFVPINPESYGQNYKVDYDLRRGHGNQGTDAKFKSTAPEHLKIDFILDGTGSIEGYYNPNNETVQQQFQRFKDTVYSMNGTIHRPRFCKIYWGDLTFPCVLTKIDINYTLFDAEGHPLRAKVSASFVNYISQEERVAREKKKSPDLTHVRDVTEGDRLDLLAYNFYNDSNFLLQVAKANRLTSFRNLKTGIKINFPPVEKTES